MTWLQPQQSLFATLKSTPLSARFIHDSAYKKLTKYIYNCKGIFTIRGFNFSLACMILMFMGWTDAVLHYIT